MREFSDTNADIAFVCIAGMIESYRTDNKHMTNEEIVYALLQICACLGDGDNWHSFLHEAMNECIHQEGA